MKKRILAAAFLAILLLTATPVSVVQEDQDSQKFLVTPEFRSIGKVPVKRPAPIGGPEFIEWTWPSAIKSEAKLERQRSASGVSIEVFVHNPAPGPGIADMDQVGQYADSHKQGLQADKAGKNYFFGLNFTIVVDRCPRFTFSNVITSARVVIFHAGDNYNTTAKFHANIPPGKAAIDNLPV